MTTSTLGDERAQLVQEFRRLMVPTATGDEMLINQAAILQAVFASFSRLAIREESADDRQEFFNMALRAQTQCRLTLASLANAKKAVDIKPKYATVEPARNWWDTGPDSQRQSGH